MLSKRNTGCWALCVVLGIAGCHSTGTNQAKNSITIPGIDTKQTSTSRKPIIRGRSELPPKEAARVCYATAKELEKNRRFKGAITFYEKAAKNDPNINVSEKLAVLYDQQGHFEKAVSAFRKAIKTSPKDARILNNMGYAYYNQGHWTEAETIFRKALDLDQNHKRAWMNLGLALGQQERYMEALAAFKKGVRNEAQAYSNLGFVFMTHKKFDAAKTAYMRALELEPTLEIARKTLMTLTHKGKTPAVATVVKRPKTVRAQSPRELKTASAAKTTATKRSKTSHVQVNRSPKAQQTDSTVAKRQETAQRQTKSHENVPSYVPLRVQWQPASHSSPYGAVGTRAESSFVTQSQ